jgi:hypothetical protein
MSKFNISELPDGTFEVKIEDLDNLEQSDHILKMDYESGKVPPELPPYACRMGNHIWKWYEGLTERYWYCSEPKCDKKDFDRPAPPRKIR